jgi:hypothetical protein
MAHGNARLTPAGRLTMCERIAAGRPIAHVAAEMGVSRPTATKWWQRFLAFGVAGLQDRSSRPKRSPRLVSRRVEAKIERLRRREKLGPVRIGYRLGMPASTVYRVLRRLCLHRLAWLDRPTGRVIRRYECARAGELIHVDVKKLGQIRAGGGWRVHGRDSEIARRQHSEGRRVGSRVGYDYVHSAVDDHTRLAYSEVLSDETGPTCAAFLVRATRFFASLGIAVQAVMTDNAKNYVDARIFQDTLGGSRPTGPRSMAKSSATTARCSRNGPTSGCSPQAPGALRPSTAGSTPTTITEPTPRSADSHPSAASTTSRLNTASRSRRRPRRATRYDGRGRAR